MSNKIKEISFVEFDKRIKINQTVIIPTGAVEVYGPHMPLGTDCIVAQELADLVAQKTNAMISPASEIGESSSLTGFCGTMAVEMDVYSIYMESIIKNLIRMGFKNFLFINGHGGNTCIITYLCKKYKREFGIKCAQIDCWQFIEKFGDDIFEYNGDMAHGHASESNTSIMLYLRPELVDMRKVERTDPVIEPFAGVIKYIPFEEKTKNGVIGDPTVATAEKGKLIFDRCVDKIVDFMKNEF